MPIIKENYKASTNRIPLKKMMALVAFDNYSTKPSAFIERLVVKLVPTSSTV
jgi:hypothetical protein